MGRQWLPVALILLERPQPENSGASPSMEGGSGGKDKAGALDREKQETLDIVSSPSVLPGPRNVHPLASFRPEPLLWVGGGGGEFKKELTFSSFISHLLKIPPGLFIASRGGERGSTKGTGNKVWDCKGEGLSGSPDFLPD